MDKPSYAISREVTDDDIDNLGHASNVAYVRWIQDIAVAHSEAVGLGYEGYARLGAVFVIRRNEIDYLRPLLRGDRVEVRTWIDSAMAAKCFRATEITRDGVVVARSMTTWGFVDASTGRPTRIPDEVRAAFGYSRRDRAPSRGGDGSTSQT
jgi:acyl-CoA thioester hydrolase